MSPQLISFLLLLAIAWWGGPVDGYAQDLTETDDGFEATVRHAFDVEQDGTLAIERVVGSIAISTWDQDRVEVTETIRVRGSAREEAQEYVQRSQSTMEQRGNTVSVRGPQRDEGQDWRNNAQHAFEVRLPQRFNTDVSTAGGAIHVEGPQGRVHAQTSGGAINVHGVTGEVRVSTSGGALNLANISGPVQGSTSGGAIQVEGVTGRLSVHTSGGAIRVRDVQSNVDASTSGGSVSVEAVRGAVQARTSGGDMSLRAIDGDATAQTSGGDIDFADIGGRAEARTSGGDIEGVDLRGAVRAETSAGDIDLNNVQAGVEARTSVGDIRVELAVQDVDTDYATRLATSHGDITLRLPPDLPASIQAEVKPLHQWSRDDILSDFPLSRETPDDERSSTLRSSGDLNGGGPLIELRTNGGSIRIEEHP